MRYLTKVVSGLFLISLLAGSVSNAQAQGQVRIGTVDLSKVFDNYWKKRQAEAVLKDRAAEFEKEFKVMVADFDKNKADYEKAVQAASDSNLAPDERDKRKKTAEEQLKKLKDTDDMLKSYQRQAQTNIEEQKDRMRNNILDEIKNVVATKARTANFSMVVDTAAVSGKNTPIILFNNAENDITDSVIASLNAGAPAEPAATDDKKPADAKNEKKDATKKDKK